MASKVFAPMILYIKTNSRLNLNIPKGRADVRITSVSPVYKEGTYHTTKTAPRGNITISRTPEYVSFSYIDNTNSIGFDNVEFLVSYSDGQQFLRVVRVFNGNAGSNISRRDYYNHLFYPAEVNTDSFFDLNSGLNANLLTTTAEITITDSNFKQDIEVYKIDRAISTFTVNYNGVLLDITPTIANATISGGANIKMITNIRVKFHTEIPNSQKTIYLKIEFLNIINRTTGEMTEDTVCYNQVLNTFHVNYGNRYSELTRPPYVLPSAPDFVDKTSPMPNPAMSVSITRDQNKIAPNVLNGTNAHVPYSNGNSNIRVGLNVPSNAVSLGYYENTTSSMENMISVMEASTDVKSIKKAERWFYRYNLKDNNEEQFEETIEFNGVDGTEYEGYWGILYRDLIVWEEDVEWDKSPTFLTVKKEYDGLTEQRVPLHVRYNGQGRTGDLTLTNAIYLPSTEWQDPNNRDAIVPTRYKAIATYEGISVDNKIVYGATIRYSGTVIKREGLSNITPDDPVEILMYPDDNGLLLYKDDIYVSDDSFYITDKFKDETPLYYKHRLKNKVYYTGNSSIYGDVKLVFENGGTVNPDRYKYIIELEASGDPFTYYVDIYTAFVPGLDNNIYAVYPSIEDNIFNVDKNTMERLSVAPAFDPDDFDILTMQDVVLKSSIVIKNPEVYENTTAPINITYRVKVDDYISRPYTVNVVNKKHAFSNQLENFKGDNYIISDSNNIGFLVAKEQMMKDLTPAQKAKLNEKSVYSVVFDTDNKLKNDVVIFTDPSGEDLIYANTLNDTSGTVGESLILDENGKYVIDTKIRKIYSVMCRNISSITLTQPRDMNRLKGWFPNIRYAYFNKLYERIDNSIRLIYSIPEFHSQVFGKYGKPYIDVDEERATIISSNEVIIKKTPLHVVNDENFEPINVKVWRLNNGVKTQLHIKSINFMHGTIELKEFLSDNDVVLVSYSYEELYYKYTGYYDINSNNKNLISLNLNPLSYFTYTEYIDGIPDKKPVYDLFNKTIYFYLRPMRVIKEETQEVIRENKYTVYHKVNDPSADEPFDINIGRIFMRHHASLQSTELIDTRVRGGGILESITDEVRRKLEPESDYYLDISTMNGEPYQQNSVLIFKFDLNILKHNGGRLNHEEIEAVVSKWCAAGSLPIIEYVETGTVSQTMIDEPIIPMEIKLQSKEYYFELL